MKKILIFIFFIYISCTLTGCINNNSDIIISQNIQNLKIGEQTLLTLSKEYDNIVWKSEDPNVATVDEFGVVTGIDSGIVKITATVNDKTYSILVSIAAKREDPVLKIKGEQTLYVGETRELTASISSGNTISSLTWESNNDKVATVDKDGKITAVGIGLVTITASTVTDKLIEGKLVILVRDDANILEDTIYNYIESNTTKIEGNLDLTALNEATTSVIEKNYQATIGVSNYQYQLTSLELTGIGTGIIFRQDKLENSNEYMYYALTNYHVIRDYDYLKVYLGDKDLEIDATPVISSSSMDLCIVAFRYSEDIPLATFGNMEDIKVGQFVIALGNPTGYEYYGSATFGMISYVNRSLKGEVSNFIQHDAAINPGNSGGPLFNLKGEVIGINTIKLADEDIDNMGFSIAIDTIKHFITSAENAGQF